MDTTPGALMRAHRMPAPATFELVELTAPQADHLLEGEVLIRVVAGAVCGSDAPFFRGLVSPWIKDTGPLASGVPGYPLHEIVGDVIASRTPRVKVGDRIAGWASRLCGLAEVVITDGDAIEVVTPGTTLQESLVLQPLACVLATMDRLPELQGKRIAVLGLGPFGLLFAHVARARGAARVVGVDRLDRSTVASTFGLDEAIHTSTDRWSAQLADADRPDVVIDAIGHQQSTLNDAIRALGHGGQIFCFGVPDDAVYALEFSALFRKNGHLIGGVVEHRREALSQATDYLSDHPELASLITHQFPFERAQEAFELALEPGSSGRLKIAIILNGKLDLSSVEPV